MDCRAFRREWGVGNWEWESKTDIKFFIPHSPLPTSYSPCSQLRVFRDDLFHDFRSARADGAQSGVSPGPAKRVFGRVGEAAHNLHAIVHHSLIQLAAEELGHS